METHHDNSVVRLQKIQFQDKRASHARLDVQAVAQASVKTKNEAGGEAIWSTTPQKRSFNFRSYRDNTSSLSNDALSPGKHSTVVATALNSNNSSVFHTTGKKSLTKLDVKYNNASPITVEDINALGYAPSLSNSKQYLKFGKLLHGLNSSSAASSTRNILTHRMEQLSSQRASKKHSRHTSAASHLVLDTPVHEIDNAFEAIRQEYKAKVDMIAQIDQGPDLLTSYFPDSTEAQPLARGRIKTLASTDENFTGKIRMGTSKSRDMGVKSPSNQQPRLRVVALFDRVEQKLFCDHNLALVGHVETPKSQNKSLPCVLELECECQHPIYIYVNFNKPATRSEFVIKSHQRKMLIPQSYSHLMLAADSIRFRVDSDFPSEVTFKASFHITPIAVTKAMEALADTFGTPDPKGPYKILSEDYVKSVSNMKIRSSRLDTPNRSSRCLFDEEGTHSRNMIALSPLHPGAPTGSSQKRTVVSPLNSPTKQSGRNLGLEGVI